MTSPAPLQPPPDDSDVSAEDERAGEVAVGEMTFAEYLAFSEASQDGYEYVDGLVYAMSYGTDNHGAVIQNISSRLWTVARGRKCRVYSSAVRLLTPRGNSYGPDVLVECGPRPPGASLYREHPCLVVEVLSPSTRNVDLREKLKHYREIETLQAYWIVEATWRCVYRHWRDAAGAWQFEEVTDDGVLLVPCPVATTLTLDDVYEDVEAPSARPPLRRVREAGNEYAVGENSGQPWEDVNAVPAPGD